jgi:hypothetical protein
LICADRRAAFDVSKGFDLRIQCFKLRNCPSFWRSCFKISGMLLFT